MAPACPDLSRHTVLEHTGLVGQPHEVGRRCFLDGAAQLDEPATAVGQEQKPKAERQFWQKIKLEWYLNGENNMHSDKFNELFRWRQNYLYKIKGEDTPFQLYSFKI